MRKRNIIGIFVCFMAICIVSLTIYAGDSFFYDDDIILLDLSKAISFSRGENGNDIIVGPTQQGAFDGKVENNDDDSSVKNQTNNDYERDAKPHIEIKIIGEKIKIKGNSYDCDAGLVKIAELNKDGYQFDIIDEYAEAHVYREVESMINSLR